MTAWQRLVHDRSCSRSTSAFESSKLCAPGAMVDSNGLSLRPRAWPRRLRVHRCSGIDHVVGHLVSRAEDVRYFGHFRPDSRDSQLRIQARTPRQLNPGIATVFGCRCDHLIFEIVGHLGVADRSPRKRGLHVDIGELSNAEDRAVKLSARPAVPASRLARASSPRARAGLLDRHLGDRRSPGEVGRRPVSRCHTPSRLTPGPTRADPCQGRYWSNAYA